MTDRNAARYARAMITLDIVSDTVCPWCYIGKRRLERALAERPGLDIRVGWRPFQLNPDSPRSGMARPQYLSLKFGGPERAQRIYAAVSMAGQQEGLGFRFDAIPRQPNTLDSHRLIRWSEDAGVQDRLVEILFRRYFIDGHDIGDAAVLGDAAAEAGMDGQAVRARLADGEDLELVKQEEAVARRLGINGVPTFIVNRRYAVSGAQEPSVLLHVFDLALKEAMDEPQAAETSAAE